MAHPTTATRASRVQVGTDAMEGFTIQLTGALLALAVAAVHVADQGGITALTSPAWIGWGYRAIEIGGVLTALALLLPRPVWAGRDGLGWAAGVLLGVAPFAGYVASRTVGVPGDPGDVGNWGYWVGTVSLFVEGALIVLSLTMLLGGAVRRAQPGPR
ncbi:MAG TPA: hypothetical protein VMH35_20220 [Streptosporangiaceae bacterium]|nr:hypothetical protein [Streptosporangiaceae bacterium]